MKRNKLLIPVLVLALLIIGLLLFYNTSLYTSFIKGRMESQLEKTYGTSFIVSKMDERQALFPDLGASLGFVAYSNDGIFTLGECDWKGTVERESYVHYHYAEALNGELKNIVGKHIFPGLSKGQRY